jgi:hypothetical protein
MTLPHHHNGTEYAVRIKPDRTTQVYIRGSVTPEFGKEFPRGTRTKAIMEWVKNQLNK